MRQIMIQAAVASFQRVYAPNSTKNKQQLYAHKLAEIFANIFV